MKDIILQPANINDWKILAILEKSAANKVFHPLTKEDEIKKYIKDSNVFFIVLNNKEIGTISFEEKEDNSIYFDGLTILPNCRRQGIATYALKKVLEDLKNKRVLSIVVHPENTPAILLYLKAGFVIKKWKENFYGDGEPRLFLVKTEK